MRMARGRYQFKICSLPVFPTLGFVLGFFLVVLILVSVFKSHLLEVQRIYQIWDRPIQVPEQKSHLLEVQRFYQIWDRPIHVPEQKNETAKLPRMIKQPWESTSLENVPKRGDPRVREVWNSTLAEWYYSCIQPSHRYPALTKKSGKNGYMLIEANGDLFLQKAGIADSVAIARVLDVTLVVPSLSHDPEDRDESEFGDIFDVDHFISTLAEDVRIIKRLPTNANRARDILSFVAPKKSPLIYYQIKLFPELQLRRMVKFVKTDNRLQDSLEPDLQKLRCRVAYNALRFVPSITNLGLKLVQRLREYSKTGRYIAVHIRFDQELLSSSGCYYGGGDKERKDLRPYRRRSRTSYDNKDPLKERREGRCPLTPMEVGLLLRAMGFGEGSFLYIVMGPVYGGEETLDPLKKLFPNHYTRDTLATVEELRPFQPYRSQLAAIDYTICKDSSVFVANDNGDLAKIMAGHRRFDGHHRTIRPNFEKLSLLYVARHTLGWYQFASKTRIFQEGLTGEPKEKSRGEFYEIPAACVCAKDQFEKIKTAHEGRELMKRIRKLKRNGSVGEPEREWIEVEEEKDNENGETIVDEAFNTGEDESLNVDGDEDEDIPEQWPWMMN